MYLDLLDYFSREKSSLSQNSITLIKIFGFDEEKRCLIAEYLTALSHRCDKQNGRHRYNFSCISGKSFCQVFWFRCFVTVLIVR